MIREIKHDLGGSEKSLKFGHNAFLRFAEDVWEGDPLELLNGIDPKGLTPKKMFNYYLTIYYCGLKLAKEPFTLDELRDWVADEDISSSELVIRAFTEAMLGGNGKAGEKQARKLAGAA